MSVDILATSWDQRRSMVQCCFMSTEAVRLVRTESPGRPPRLSHISWTLSFEDVPLVEFMYLVFTRMPGESYRRQLRSLLLYLFRVFRALINSLVCWFRSLEGRLLVFSVLQLCKKYTRLRVQAHTHTHTRECAQRERVAGRHWSAALNFFKHFIALRDLFVHFSFLSNISAVTHLFRRRVAHNANKKNKKK